jgi:hypothetical protein
MSEHEAMTQHEGAEGYEGRVTVAAGGASPRTAVAALAARFDPLAGRVVWSGRLDLPVAPRVGLGGLGPRAAVGCRDLEGGARLQRPR